MTYAEFKSEYDAVSEWTRQERNELAAARVARDEARAGWQDAFTLKGGSKREERIRATRQDYERANNACALVEERLVAAREGRQRAVKAAWQAECDARTQTRVDREDAAGFRVRVLA
jgi:hypothetical protein